MSPGPGPGQPRTGLRRPSGNCSFFGSVMIRAKAFARHLPLGGPFRRAKSGADELLLFSTACAAGDLNPTLRDLRSSSSPPSPRSRGPQRPPLERTHRERPRTPPLSKGLVVAKPVQARSIPRGAFEARSRIGRRGPAIGPLVGHAGTSYALPCSPGGPGRDRSRHRSSGSSHPRPDGGHDSVGLRIIAYDVSEPARQHRCVPALLGVERRQVEVHVDEISCARQAGSRAVCSREGDRRAAGSPDYSDVLFHVQTPRIGNYYVRSSDLERTATTDPAP